MIPRVCSGSLYEALELSPDCSSAEVKRQYRRLALQYHPDRTGGTTTEKFQDIERANHILSSTVTRRLYDQFGSSGLQLVNTDNDDLEAQFESAIRRIRGLFFAVFVIMASLFVSACVACHLADDSWGRGTAQGPHGPSARAWILTFIPVYVVCLPAFLVALGLAISSLTRCSVVLLFWSFESSLSIAIVGSSVAALAGRTPATTAFAVWMVWYGLRTVRKLFALLPPVFARTLAEAEAAALEAARVAAAQEAGTTLDDTALEGDSVARKTLQEVLCLGTYWFETVIPTVMEWTCVWAFLALCMQRAAAAAAAAAVAAASSSSSARTASASRSLATSESQQSQLSFWVIFSPLIVLACVRLVLKTIVVAWFARTMTSTPLRSSGGTAGAADSVVIEGGEGQSGVSAQATNATTHVNATSGSSAGVFAPTASSTSCRDVLSTVVTFSIPDLSLLWMACGWAATAERLFNAHQPPHRFYETAWMASLPLLALLLFPAMLMLALLIIVSLAGRTLLGVDGDPYADHDELDEATLSGAAEASGAASGSAAAAAGGGGGRERVPLSNKGSSPSHKNYQSTADANRGKDERSGLDGLD